MAGIDATVGSRIAKGRRRRGWTQRDLGLAIDRSESWISQIERGVLPLDSLTAAERIADALGLQTAQVLALDVRWPEKEGARPGGVEEWAGVERRTFVKGAVAAPLTGMLHPLEPERIDHARRTTVVDATTVQQLGAVAAAYRYSYRQVPATSLLSAGLAQFRLIMSLCPERQQEPQRRLLLSQAAQMAALVSVVSFLDLGDRDGGHSYLNTAHEIAKTLDDSELSALLWAGRAFHTGYGGDPEGGVDCALVALDHAAGASARMHAWVAAVASEMHATTGDESSCRAALDQARGLLDDPVDDDRWGGIGWFDLAKIDAYEGGDFVRLGRCEEALPLLDAALERLDPSMRRHRATAHADRADAYASAGNSEAAIADAHQSLTLLEVIHHDQTLRRINDLHRRLRTSRAIPAVRGLAEHLIDVRSTMRSRTCPTPAARA